MRKVSLMDIKQALADPRFRDALPIEAREDVIKYLNNPNCACNMPFYKSILKNYKDHVLSYFPNTEVVSEDEELKNLAKNNWTVINCKINELELELKKLPPGRKNIAVARYEDNVTCIIDEIDVLY